MKIVLFDHSMTYSFNRSVILCALFRMAHRNSLISVDSLLCHVSDWTLSLFFKTQLASNYQKNQQQYNLILAL